MALLWFHLWCLSLPNIDLPAQKQVRRTDMSPKMTLKPFPVSRKMQSRRIESAWSEFTFLIWSRTFGIIIFETANKRTESGSLRKWRQLYGSRLNILWYRLTTLKSHLNTEREAEISVLRPSVEKRIHSISAWPLFWRWSFNKCAVRCQISVNKGSSHTLNYSSRCSIFNLDEFCFRWSEKAFPR